MFDRGTSSNPTSTTTTKALRSNHSWAFHCPMAPFDRANTTRAEKSKLKDLISVQFRPASLAIDIGDSVYLQDQASRHLFKLNRTRASELLEHRSTPKLTKTYSSRTMIQKETDSGSVLIPGLPEDLAKTCLALVPRSYLPVIGAVSKSWMAFIGSQEFIAVRKEVGRVEEWVYVLTAEAEGKGTRWEVLGSPDRKKRMMLPPMPGSAKAGFGVVVLGAKLFVMAGYDADRGKEFVSDEVYQYDACLNRWTVLAKMNTARHDFACAELDGVIYIAGGFGPAGDCLCSVETYSPQRNKWTVIESLRRPRWGCFAFGFDGRLFVLGGRSSFTIGNSRSIDVYDPRRRAWDEVKKGCVMVTSHVVVDRRLLCVEWKSQRTLAVFDPQDGSWERVPVPLTGSSRTRFCLGVLGGKVLLFSMEEEAGYQTLVYDPAAPGGAEWQTSELKPSGLCICSVTIEV